MIRAELGTSSLFYFSKSVINGEAETLGTCHVLNLLSCYRKKNVGQKKTASQKDIVDLFDRKVLGTLIS